MGAAYCPVISPLFEMTGAAALYAPVRTDRIMRVAGRYVPAGRPAEDL